MNFEVFICYLVLCVCVIWHTVFCVCVCVCHKDTAIVHVDTFQAKMQRRPSIFTTSVVYTSTAPGNGVQTESAESQLITPCLTSSACVLSSVFLIVYQSFYFFSQCIFSFSQYIYGSLNIYSLILQYFLFLFQPAQCCCLYQHVC